MSELNFCPYCDAPQHKLLEVSGDSFFCRECHAYFSCEQHELVCLKCSRSLRDSDFPAPDGGIVLQCSHCKKMYAGRDVFKARESSREKSTLKTKGI